MPLPELWTSRQRLIILCLLAGIGLYLAWQLFTRPVNIDSIQIDAQPTSAPALVRLNPNTDGQWDLAALPTIGPARAKAIVEYRDKWKSEHPGEMPFAQAEDLQQIKGIGPATVELIRPYLRFDDAPTTSLATPPATSPATSPAISR